MFGFRTARRAAMCVSLVLCFAVETGWADDALPKTLESGASESGALESQAAKTGRWTAGKFLKARVSLGQGPVVQPSSVSEPKLGLGAFWNSDPQFTLFLLENPEFLLKDSAETPGQPIPLVEPTPWKSRDVSADIDPWESRDPIQLSQQLADPVESRPYYGDDLVEKAPRRPVIQSAFAPAEFPTPEEAFPILQTAAFEEVDSSRRGWQSPQTSMDLEAGEPAAVIMEIMGQIGSLLDGTAFAHSSFRRDPRDFAGTAAGNHIRASVAHIRRLEAQASEEAQRGSQEVTRESSRRAAQDQEVPVARHNPQSVAELRDASRRLEEIAFNLETQNLYSGADRIRELASELRREARSLQAAEPISRRRARGGEPQPPLAENDRDDVLRPVPPAVPHQSARAEDF
ncbi:MAG: hypothetical protein N2C14_29035 [Planctomycetales bacterium]